MKLLFVVFIAFLSSVIDLSAQDCVDYHQYHCDYSDYTFFYSRQSKSMLMQRGQTTDINIVAYGGEDYYVSVCGHRKLGDLGFKVLVDNEERTLIYDNSLEEEYTNFVTFSNEYTRNLIIEISVPEGNDKNERCVGVILQFKSVE